MNIYLIRHGETTGDLEDRYGGAYDDHLTEKGQADAKRLGEQLKDKGIEIIYYSPKLRTKEATALTKQTFGFLRRAVSIRLLFPGHKHRVVCIMK